MWLVDAVLYTLSTTEGSIRQLCSTWLLRRTQGNCPQSPVVMANWKMFLCIDSSSFPAAPHQSPNPVHRSHVSLCFRLSFLGVEIAGQGAMRTKPALTPSSATGPWSCPSLYARCQSEQAAHAVALPPAQQTRALTEGVFTLRNVAWGYWRTKPWNGQRFALALGRFVLLELFLPWNKDTGGRVHLEGMAPELESPQWQHSATWFENLIATTPCILWIMQFS